MTAMPGPMPFIVGVPRSGTTLLRFMLCSGRDLAIPPETWFLRDLVRPGRQFSAASFCTLLTGHPVWPDFGLDAETLARDIAGLGEFRLPEAVRVFYRLYAARHGCPRVGDKTPLYGAIMPEIERLLPEARFVHIIRDGRDVAASLREVWFAPSREPAALAAYWSEHLGTFRARGAEVKYYMEIRYEDLLSDPLEALRTLCGFLDLRFDEAMLRPGRTAESLLAEHGDRRGKDGTVVISGDSRRWHSRRTTGPLDTSRVGAFRAAFTAAEIETFEAAAGPALAELGYVGA